MMSEQKKDGIEKERYKRVPVYTKEDYGSPKPETDKKVIDPLPWIVIIVLVLSLVYSVTRPKQAWETRQETNEWYASGSFDLCEEHLKEQLKDPRSYERAGEIKAVEDDGKEKRVIWVFRSKNGFGGMNAARAVCKIIKDKRWVAATILE